MSKKDSKKSYARKSGYLKYYSATSEAYDTNVIPAPSTPKKLKVKPERTLKAKPKRTLKPKKRIVFIDIGKTDKGLSWKAIITMVIIFIYAMALVFNFTALFQKQSNIKALSLELRKLEDGNILTKATTSERYDITEIESSAVRMGMNKPSPYQIISINVPKQSHVVKYETTTLEEVEDDGSFLSKLAKFMTKGVD